MATTATSSDKPAAKAVSDLDQVMDHVAAIRDDVASLTAATTRLLAGQARTQARRAAGLAEDAAEQAKAYRDAVADVVRKHPFAAVGIAALAGLAISALGKR